MGKDKSFQFLAQTQLIDEAEDIDDDEPEIDHGKMLGGNIILEGEHAWAIPLQPWSARRLFGFGRGRMK